MNKKIHKQETVGLAFTLCGVPWYISKVKYFWKLVTCKKCLKYKRGE